MGLIIELALLGLAGGCLNGLLAMGFGLMMRTTRIFHVAYGGVYLAAAYVYYYAQATWNLAPVIAVVLTAVAAVGLNLLIYWGIYWPLLHRGGRIFLTGFVGSLGLLTIIDNALGFVNTGGFLSFPKGMLTTKQVQWGSYYLPSGDIVGIVLAVAAVLALHWFLGRSRYGHGLRALSADRELAAEYGINVQFYDSVAYAIGGLLLVPVAIIVPSLSGLSTSSGLTVVTAAFTAAIVGGVASTPGTLAAAIILGVLESLAVDKISGSWEQALGLAVMVLVLLVKPQGLFGSRSAASVMAGGAA
jgi:branched-chain amino acid transport system permease protein